MLNFQLLINYGSKTEYVSPPLWKKNLHFVSVKKGSAGNTFHSQGVVTYMSTVEVFVTAIKFFDWQKVCLIVAF